MSLPQRARGVKVLKAVSSPLRLQILNFLFDKGALTYTELMTQLKMNPSRDAGRFAYHLKFLLKANLVDVDSDAKKYFLTDLGKMVIDVADRVEKKAVKPKGMLVRTSHFTFEEFDANKIANNLIREGKVPPDLAQKTAKETEKRLVKSKIKYLTAALIREIVNGLLIEKGFEDYRHKLTRLGLPVHEVSALIDAKNPDETRSILAMAGETVLREYTLLNVLPRDLSDAHLSGALHIDGLSTWILKPSEVLHDLRFFLQNGMQLDNFNSRQHSDKPPENFEAALSTAFDMLLFTRQEVNETQTVDYFNVFLAPYIKNIEPDRVKEHLRLFILNVNQHVDAAFGLDLAVPAFLAAKPAVAPKGKTNGKYGDYTEEAKLLTSLIVDIFAEESALKPILNPKLILKVTPELAKEENANATLLKAHSLATDKTPIYFARTPKKREKPASYSATGIKLKSDLTGDWETDTMRTGCLGYVSINLPRIARESNKDNAKFFDLLKERCELALRALGIKNRALRQHGKAVLPFLLHGYNGDMYFRLENCTGVVNLAGFAEAVEAFTSEPVGAKENTKFALDVVQNAQAYVSKLGRKHGKRLSAAILGSPQASARLARLDVEKYGVMKVKFSGTREKPFYITTQRMQLQTGNFLSVPSEQLELLDKLKGLKAGANLAVIDVEDLENKPDDLLKLTLSLLENHEAEVLTYNHAVTYCKNCQKSWFGNLHKCPSCGSIGTLVEFDRFKGT
ncbi:MAG: ArsR family transcriptional regulator [Candidatus Bathyarchaeota archaeon]|nr:ArsR family transcriptional regulator [Candidatus Bathyarchaeota archaeon]